MPAFSFLLDRSLTVPLHHQIAAGLRDEIDGGQLPAGTRLPPTREVAQDLGVSRGTVQKAYEELIASGIARARVGRGTFVAGDSAGVDRALPGRVLEPAPSPAGSTRAATPRPAPRSREPLYAFDLRGVEDPGWERLARWAGRPGTISFAGGVPDSRLFPVRPFKSCLNAALDEEGSALLQYSPSRGYAPFLEFLSRHLHRRGLPAVADRILVVSGSQQGLDLIGRALIAPGDTVIVEEPTYSGALALFRILGARLVSVPMDADGMDVEHLARLLTRVQPKLVYTIPTFHNPTGHTLAPARRQRLLEVCAAAGVPVVEDDSDGELRFEGGELPPLAAQAGAAGVIHLGTFSKLFFPGLRLGWVVAEREILQRLEATKRVADLHTPPLLQAAMARFAAAPASRRLAREVRSRYRARRDVMCAALEKCMPAGVRWTHPQGGLSLMAELPAGLDAAELLPLAAAAGVLFAPGHLFSARGGRHGTLRLTFGNVDEKRIEEGVGRLARVVEAATDGARHEEQQPAVAMTAPV